MKNEKIYAGFLIMKIQQILKCFGGAKTLAKISNLWGVKKKQEASEGDLITAAWHGHEETKKQIYLPAETYIPVETLACSVHKKSVVQVH